MAGTANGQHRQQIAPQPRKTWHRDPRHSGARIGNQRGIGNHQPARQKDRPAAPVQPRSKVKIKEMGSRMAFHKYPRDSLPHHRAACIPMRPQDGAAHHPRNHEERDGGTTICKKMHRQCPRLTRRQPTNPTRTSSDRNTHSAKNHAENAPLAQRKLGRNFLAQARASSCPKARATKHRPQSQTIPKGRVKKQDRPGIADARRQLGLSPQHRNENHGVGRIDKETRHQARQRPAKDMLATWPNRLPDKRFGAPHQP